MVILKLLTSHGSWYWYSSYLFDASEVIVFDFFDNGIAQKLIPAPDPIAFAEYMANDFLSRRI